MRILRQLLLHVLLAVLASSALATEGRADFQVAYINASGGSVDYLTNYGINVTYLNNPMGLTLAQLAPYDAILIAGNGAFTESTNVGNIASEFADSGRGVVLTAFDLFLLGGNIMTPSYSPLNLITTADFVTNATLGTVSDPANAILTGVNPSQVASEYNVDAGLNPGATLVADWAYNPSLPPVFGQTRVAVAYTPLANSSVAFLNLFPGVGNVQNLNFSTDDELMVANALKFSAVSPTGPSPNPAPEPSTFILAGIGGACLLGLVRRRGTDKI